MAANDPKPMNERQLAAILTSEVTNSQGFLGGELSEQRRKALEYYLGEPFGNEIEGRSQVVLTDVADTIEWVMPSLMRLFYSSERVALFEPMGPEDEKAAEQATSYVNYVFNKKNDGFNVLFSWFKDALLQKNGIVKTYWEERDHTETHTFSGITEAELGLILNEDGIEVVSQEVTGQEPVSVDEMGQPVFADIYDLEVSRTTTKGQIVTENVPPEEFLISRRAMTMDDAPFVAHRTKKTASELLEAGYPYKQVMELSESYAGDGEYNEERVARYDLEDTYPETAHGLDPAMREMWVIEAYMQVDYDGDGIAELRKITFGGEVPYVILDNEPVDEVPFDSITPFPMPHRFYGRSLADVTMDLQLIRSTIMRQLLDNMYLVNNTRTAAWEGNVNLDDLLNNQPGGIVRTKRHPGEVLQEMVTPSLGQHAFPLLEWLDDVRATRTGVTKYSQGLDANALNDTATGVSRIMSAANQRIELIARIFAETGVRDLFRRILRLSIKHQDKPQMMRLHNEWTEVDPRVWNAEMDLSVEVGLGYDNQDQEMAVMHQILQIQQQAIMLQGGTDGPLVTLDNVHSALVRLTSAAGLKNPANYWSDPNSQAMQQKMAMKAQQPPPPNPEMIKVQMEQQKMQLEAAKFQHQAQLDQARMQAEMEEKAMAASAAQQKAQLDIEGKRVDIAADKDKTVAEVEAKAADIALQEEKIETERQKMEMEAEKTAQQIFIEREKLRLEEERLQIQAFQAVQSSTEKADPAGVSDKIKKASAEVKGFTLVRDQDGQIVGAKTGEPK